MKIEQIRQVLSIYQSGSINKAAQNLFLSQPYISNSLKSLERELQQKIFIRSYNGIQLTEFGKIFIQNAQGLLKYADQIEYAAKDFSAHKFRCHFLFRFLIFCLPKWFFGISWNATKIQLSIFVITRHLCLKFSWMCMTVLWN